MATGPNADSHVQRHLHGQLHCHHHQHADSDLNCHQHLYSYVYAHPNPYSYFYTNIYRNVHGHLYSHRHSHSYPNQYAHPTFEYSSPNGCTQPHALTPFRNRRDTIARMLRILHGWRFTLPEILLGFSLLLGACAAPLRLTEQPTPNSTPTQDTAAAETRTSPTKTESQGSTVLSVWLPPSFDPNSGSLAAGMLQARLDEFVEQHPQVRVEVRVKAEEGTGGLLDSLLTAQTAAPLALPDLVLLPHNQLAAAAANQVVVPIAELTEVLDSDDWYPFAQEMARVDGTSFGIPFAADALVLAYRPTAVVQVPSTWADTLDSGQELGFAAADPQALFTLAQLQALEPKAAQDGGLSYSEETLTTVFEFFSAAQEKGVLPFWLNQYQTSEQSWQAFSEGRIPMVAAWTSRTFDSRNVDVSAAPLPTQDGKPFALVKGWLWAVATQDQTRLTLIAELAEFLTTPEFISQWTAAGSLLPPRHSSLGAWSPGDMQILASQIMELAVALPDKATLDLWGPPLAEAVVAMLKQELTPDLATQQVLAAVKQ